MTLLTRSKRKEPYCSGAALSSIAMIEATLPALHRYASILVTNKRDQDDLVRACLVRATDRLHTLCADPSLRIWLFSTLHNIFVRHQRGWKVRNNSAAFDLTAANQFEKSADQDAWLARETLRALYSLPLDQRQVLTLISVEDLSYAEVAQVLGIPLSSVMSHLSHGRERLRQVMEGQKTEAEIR